jgi:hypothetical protein
MSADARARLADQQAALVAALAGRGAPPEGFDAARLRTAAASLVTKRVEAVARAWPRLAAGLGRRFGEQFRVFAAANPLPRDGGPLADGRAFVRWLTAAGNLPDEGRFQALAVDLRYTTSGDGLRLRRGPSFKAALLNGRRRLVLAVRLPWLGEFWLNIPLGRRR